MKVWKPAALAALVIALHGCETVEEIVDTYRAETPHEAYLVGLQRAGLDETALTQRWIHEAARALQDPAVVELPLLDEGWFASGEPSAVGYQFTLPRGRQITVSLTVASEDDGRVFLDLLRLPDDPEESPRPVGADTLPDGSIQYEPWRSGEYLVRVQPELLHGGRYQLRIGEDPALAFPVLDHGMGAIQSTFGVARDGGRREHHGVDIFARRGTPVVAAVEGRVNRVNVTNLGGKVVWLRDERMERNLYYAHLDSQAVSSGDRVQVGDTLGFVGNSGNARTTPPHLHFGIYSRGPTDPDPFIRPSPRAMAELDVDAEQYGTWVRTLNDGIRLRTGPSRGSDELDELAAATPMRVLGGSGDWYRVRLGDGRSGYIAARLVESVDQPLERTTVVAGSPVRSAPRPDSPAIEVSDEGTEVELLGRMSGYLLVRTPAGRAGWVMDSRVDSQQP